MIDVVTFKVPTLFSFQLHANADMYGLDRVDATQKLRFSVGDQLLSFLGLIAASVAVYFYINDNKMHWPVVGFNSSLFVLWFVFVCEFLVFLSEESKYIILLILVSIHRQL